MAKRKLWAIGIMHGGDLQGHLVERSNIVAVYDSEDAAKKEAKWLNDFHRKSSSKTIYEPIRWKDDGSETSIQFKEEKVFNYSKMEDGLTALFEN